MKVLLTHPERDLDMEAKRPALADDLVQDLELDVLFEAMGAQDEFLRAVAETALLDSLTDLAAITYRQQTLADCQRHRSVIDSLYEVAVDAITEEHKQFHFSIDRASVRLHGAIEAMGIFLERLRHLRRIAETRSDAFDSPAFVRFFAMLRKELSEDYLEQIALHIKELHFEHGILVSARLGAGNQGVAFELRELPEHRRGRLRRLIHQQPEIHAFNIDPRDQGGARALDELQGRGLDVAAGALEQAAGHVLAFFKQLRAELGYYRAALHLQDALKAKGMPVCFPDAAPAGSRRLEAVGLYDPVLCLTSGAAVVTNDVDAGERALIFVTGANQGGKSTFLRSLGVAQLLLQAGLFVPAKSFAANVCSGVFTHYKRAEDATMTSGKFEEELLRMDDIVEHIKADGLVLFNESFAATREREGARIATDVVDVLLEKRRKVVFVTHFYELALTWVKRGRDDTLFLQAQRNEDGTRTHRIVPGQPSQTAYGRDLYDQVFGASCKYS